ncbi:MAG: hypothetical protein FWH17_08050 [Oscillospiraceae bacterium]|nr:hypothetical protein [Oscillospiraceae bacterium]
MSEYTIENSIREVLTGDTQKFEIIGCGQTIRTVHPDIHPVYGAILLTNP